MKNGNFPNIPEYTDITLLFLKGDPADQYLRKNFEKTIYNQVNSNMEPKCFKYLVRLC